jgi:membrane associated rhomboid family serine protease
VVQPDAVCFRHPDRKAAVGCQRCDRPVCANCMQPASVGFHCPECVRRSGQRVYRARDLAPRKHATVALLALNAVVFVLQLASSGGVVRTSTGLTFDGLLFGPFVADGEYWRLLTSGFLHANLPHVLFNSWALWIFGPLVESTFVRWRMLGIYLAGLFGGSALVMLFDWTAPTLGASAAVLGLGGALVAAMVARGASLRSNNLVGVLLINLLLPLLLPGISFWGHLGGIGGGFVAGFAVASLSRARAGAAASYAALAGIVAALALLGVVAAGSHGI